MKPTLRTVGEWGLITALARRQDLPEAVRVGIGDDAAVLRPPRQRRLLLFTTDMLVEGVHFRWRSATPAQVGRKALACSLSDIAAMGGQPTVAVVALGAPPGTHLTTILGVYRGMRTLARRHRVAIVGGDTVRAPRVTLAVALLGTVAAGELTLRSGARAGDRLFVTGRLGGSLRSGRHVRFEPRLQAARDLVRRWKPTAMMDLSDGIASDACRLAEASRVGLEVEVDRLPRHTGVSPRQALCDGEDFELLFTLPPGRAARFERQGRRTVPATLIGRVLPRRAGLRLIDQWGRRRPWPLPRFRHF